VTIMNNNRRAPFNAGGVFIVLAALPVFAAQSATFTTLYSFTGADDGWEPSAPSGLIEGSDGNLYGTTPAAGSDNDGGTLFRITKSGTLTTLHSFPGVPNGLGRPSDSTIPSTVLQGRDGALYGTTFRGGMNGYGTIFKFSVDGSLTTLYDFQQSTDGAYPQGLIQGSDGNFYGSTVEPTTGGSVVYQLTPTGVLTPLYHFACNCEYGPIPVGFGLLAEGAPLTFYGAINPGHDGGGSEIYSVTSTGLYSTVARFEASAGLENLTVGADKAMYGVTLDESDNRVGSVIRVLSDGTWTSLYQFKGTGDGSFPDRAPITGPDGTLYGSTGVGGKIDAINCTGRGCGVIYAISPAGVYSVVYQFTGGDDGISPAAFLIGSDGALYGTTGTGGAHGVGSVFRITLNAPAVPSSPASGPAHGGGGSLDGFWMTVLALLAGVRCVQRYAALGLRNRVQAAAAKTSTLATMTGDELINSP
jgi:uncharacterized repeat protein (TIGR03803 family)